MKWLKRLFRKNESAHSQKENQTAKTYSFDSDEFYSKNSDIMDGYEFCATLQLRTPLKVLERHGEIFRGPPSKLPEVPSSQGIWVPKTKSWNELGIDMEEMPEGTIASDIGPVKGVAYLKFLKAFRKIAESDEPVQERISAIDSLRTKSPEDAEIIKRLETVYDDFPSSFFYSIFTQLPGVGPKIAKNLFEAGYKSNEQVLSASEEELANVPGIGSKLAKRIKGEVEI